MPTLSTTAATPSTSFEEVCERLKKIGYSRCKSVRLYGEVFQLLSDPYPDGEHFAIEGHSDRTPEVRVIRIPKFIVGSARAACRERVSQASAA